MKKHQSIKKCPITNSENYFSYLDLGTMPLVNNLSSTKEESLNCDKFELKLNYFPSSKLTSLSQAVNPEILYSNYLYKSSISQPYIEHCKKMYFFCNDMLELSKGDKVLDIGGNDGTLLKTFLEINPDLDILNVDMSANLVKECIENNIPALNKKWGLEVSKSIPNKFKLITTTNCFQHTKDINDFVKGVKNSLNPTGLWCLEFPYWKNSLLTNQFDQVYHEHAYYYLISPLKLLFEKHNLQIINITSHDIHGGSLRVIISHKDTFPIPPSVDMFIKEEENILNESYYKKWAKNIKKQTLHMDFLSKKGIGTEDFYKAFTDVEVDKMKRIYDWFISDISEEDLNRQRKDFYLFFSEHDKRRGTDFISVFPELSEFYEECKNV